MPTINKLHKVREKKVPYKHDGKKGAIFYNTKQWHNLRNRYIKEHPFCELCEQRGIVRLAEEVHHKEEFLKGITDEEKWQLLLDEDNLMSLCSDCHHEIHNDNRKDKKNSKEYPPLP